MAEACEKSRFLDLEVLIPTRSSSKRKFAHHLKLLTALEHVHLEIRCRCARLQ